VHEKVLHLGRNHTKYKQAAQADESEQARAADEAAEEDEFRLGLIPTCCRYGIAHPFAGDKDRLQRSFLDHPDDAPFTNEQVRYAAADAVAAAQLYPHQVAAASLAGTLEHLLTVEMPWAYTTTRMVWNGVRVDLEKGRRVLDSCGKHLPQLERELGEYGITNVRSSSQLRTFFEARGLVNLFRKRGGYSFDRKKLKIFSDRDPAIPLIRAARRVLDTQADKTMILRQDLVGADGRLHPEYRQLGAHSGRQTSTCPNVLGLDSTLRPLIVPDPGCGIGEVDLSQIEVGIAAAVYRDRALLEMFNTGDVYCAMAQRFYANSLSEEDRTMPYCEFKRKHAKRRSTMKICTLGLIFGLTSHGIADQLNVSLPEASSLRAEFMRMFPALRTALTESPVFGAMRGHVATTTGLRRHRNGSGTLSNWERNWMTNHPVQGSAAAVFKVAGNRLDRLYRKFGARLIIPLHDAFVFESPIEHLAKVAELTQRVMCEAVQESFPELRCRAEINIEHPHCWNKEGHADSIDRWMEDPLYTI
jgi:DNA polymerase-1